MWLSGRYFLIAFGLGIYTCVSIDISTTRKYFEADKNVLSTDY